MHSMCHLASCYLLCNDEDETTCKENMKAKTVIDDVIMTSIILKNYLNSIITHFSMMVCLINIKFYSFVEN